MVRLGLLIDDRIGKPTNPEQRRDSAHRLRVPEADVATRTKAVIEILRRDAA
jgi:hypothetical protein